MKPVRPSLAQTLGAIALCEVAGLLTAIFLNSSIGSWYQSLQKPPGMPGQFVIGPFLFVLYALLGVALAYYMAAPPENRLKALTLKWFWVLVGLNVLWAVVFLGLRSPSGGYALAFCLWFAVVAVMWVGSRVSGLATWLVVPYFLWVTGASMFNFGVMSLNVIRPKVQAMDKDPRNQDPFFLMKKPTPKPTDPAPEPFIGH